MTSNTVNTQPERILATAFECLSAGGYANVTMRHIAERAGVALSQLTYYFKTKEALFIGVINMMAEQIMTETEAAMNQGRLASAAELFRKLNRDKPNLIRLFIDFSAQSVWVPSFRQHLDRLFVSVAGIIERHLPRGVVAGDKQQPASKLILGALFGASVQIMLSPDGENAETLNLAEEILSLHE
jgi:AcrR family transcriptional regulator